MSKKEYYIVVTYYDSGLDKDVVDDMEIAGDSRSDAEEFVLRKLRAEVISEEVADRKVRLGALDLRRLRPSTDPWPAAKEALFRWAKDQYEIDGDLVQINEIIDEILREVISAEGGCNDQNQNQNQKQPGTPT